MEERRTGSAPDELRKAFDDPHALAASTAVPERDKIRALLDWKQDLLELQKAGEENMPDRRGDSNVAGRLEAVTNALIFLGYADD